MNLIYDGESLSTAKYSSGQIYSLEDITVFVARKFSNCKICLVIRDANNKCDVLELKQINSTNAKYFNYSVSFDSTVKIESGDCSVSLLGINLNSGFVDFSSSFINIKLDNINYNFKSQISMIEQFSKASASTYRQMYELYNKMIKITNLNIEMIKDSEGDDSQ